METHKAARFVASRDVVLTSEAYFRRIYPTTRAATDFHYTTTNRVASSMTGLALDEQIRKAGPVPAIDGLTAAVKLAEALYGYGLKTGKVGAYAWPHQKEVVGGVVAFAKSACARALFVPLVAVRIQSIRTGDYQNDLHPKNRDGGD